MNVNIPHSKCIIKWHLLPFIVKCEIITNYQRIYLVIHFQYDTKMAGGHQR